MNEDNSIQTFLLIIIIGLLAGLMVFMGTNSNISEGMIMNKMISQGYNDCTEMNECSYAPTKYIIAIQNGDNKDWWYVSKEYYDNVSVGDWVRR